MAVLSKGFFNLIVYWYLKTFIIMSAKIDLKFLCQWATDCYIQVIKINVDDELGYENNQIKSKDVIRIGLTEFGKENQIWLDKPTAIKFAKTLRTEINKIKD